MILCMIVLWFNKMLPRNWELFKFDFSLKLCYYIYNEMKGEMIYGIKES